ncbi:DUF2786 domain-containing protein [Micromonospora sp. WMMD882]|uniref:DUF2786 domain-containing protein n=1 Tax=Micromonospora sp. WMMD882 TaxID=3015151 RepID=UPI00248C32DE|nr:DUF2786 domain-containing protein [Micromonospora sp. WMMD882]WBB80727.1 DUF2786 domain-containing protein [Micromonospora sp. WMMD882]
MADVEALIGDAIAAARSGDVRLAERQLDRLVVGDPTAVDPALSGRLVRAVGRLWPRGWQPVDVARIVIRRAGVRPGRLLADVLAADRRGQARTPAWWDEQLAALDARVWWADDAAHLAGWAARERLDRVTALREVVEVLAVLESLPPVAVLRPPPGASEVGAAPSGRSGSRMLDRVRALLAKAESTSYPAEAEALTGKAQELMARHSIDEALLETGPADQPGGIRLGTDAPYAGAKALLAQEVAAANRCESVWSDDLGFATVLGFPADLDAVEVLYTSLLVQATTAMLRGRAQRRRASGRRTREYDESFLNAFALRIGERLRAATERTSREAAATDGGERLLPVLATRSDAVRRRAETLFPEVTRGRLTIRDEEGWSSGAAAADRARLAPDARPPRPGSGGGRPSTRRPG